MKWDYCIALYTERFCTAKGLAVSSIAAYRSTLRHFAGYVEARLGDKPPEDVVAYDVLEYAEYLRRERRNGASAVNRQVTVLREFYRALVALGYLESRRNPMMLLPKIKAAPRKFAETLDEEEISRLIDSPDTETVLGMRDRALLILIYGTGMRASECSGLDDADVDLKSRTVRVLGKGGHERTVPLNDEVVRALSQYRLVRGELQPGSGFFRSRRGRRMSRGAIYERVRLHAQKARITKKVSPHRLRHTFATHLVKSGVDIVTIRDLLGHRVITSTQIYLHMTAEDLRRAAERHPVSRLVEKVADLLPDVKLPFQKSPLKRLG